MLNNEICKRCINKTCTPKWNKNDDENWEKGLLDCADNYDELSSIKELYEDCSYKLEHIVSDKEINNVK